MGTQKKRISARHSRRVTPPLIPSSEKRISSIRKFRKAERRTLFHETQDLPDTHKLFLYNGTFYYSPILSIRFLNWWQSIKIETLIHQDHDSIRRRFPYLKKKDFVRDYSKSIFSALTFTFFEVSNIHIVADSGMRQRYVHWGYTIIQNLKEGYRLAFVMEDKFYNTEKKRDCQTILQFDFVTMKLSVHPWKRTRKGVGVHRSVRREKQEGNNKNGGDGEAR